VGSLFKTNNLFTVEKLFMICLYLIKINDQSIIYIINFLREKRYIGIGLMSKKIYIHNISLIIIKYNSVDPTYYIVPRDSLQFYH